MAIDTKERGVQEPAHGQDGGNQEEGYLRPPDYLGRSVRVVGPQHSPDPYDDPHAKNRRGELGRPLYHWYFNTISRDPLSRMGFNTHNADPKNLLTSVISRAPRGGVNPEKTPVPDPVAMTQHIKRVAAFYGADAVGIARTDPAYLYRGGARRAEDDTMVAGPEGETPDTIAKRFPYAICYLVAWDYAMGRAHRHRIGDAAYFFSSGKNNIIAANLASYVRELGYSVRQGVANTMPMALLAGLGELGRHGIIISEKFGSRVHPGLILTDLPLVPDNPIDIGVADFCQICRKCATTCPTNSISHDDKKVINGVEKFAINWKTCYALRPYLSHIWQICLTCVAVCPYTKPNVWWRSLAVGLLRNTPIPLRPLVTRPLKWLDDLVWGTVPRKRVRWLGYDSGREPGVDGCNIAGCSCHKEEEASGLISEVGVYAPKKENAKRFHKR